MNIHTLKNRIKVLAWSLGENGATISYIRTDKTDKQIDLICPPIDTCQGLSSIASIEDYHLSPLTVTMDECTYTWENFSRQYPLSQFEAIILVSRREAEMEESKMMDILELDEAIKALLS